MATRFERHVSRRAAGSLTGNLQRFDFGMRPAEAAMVAFADQLRSAGDHAPDQRIRLRPALAEPGKLQRASHVPRIELTTVVGGLSGFVGHEGSS